MTEENVNEGTEQTDDISAIEEMRLQYDAKLKQEQDKYAKLYKYTCQNIASGNTKDPATVEPVLTPEETYVNACKTLYTSNLGYEQAKAMLQGDEYQRQTKGRSIFSSEEGVLDSKEENISDTTRDLLQYAVDNCDGDENRFNAIIKSYITKSF